MFSCTKINLIFCANVNFDFCEYKKITTNERRKKLNEHVANWCHKANNLIFFLFQLLDVVVLLKLLFKDRSPTIVYRCDFFYFFKFILTKHFSIKIHYHFVGTLFSSH